MNVKYFRARLHGQQKGPLPSQFFLFLSSYRRGLADCFHKAWILKVLFNYLTDSGQPDALEPPSQQPDTMERAVIRAFGSHPAV